MTSVYVTVPNGDGYIHKSVHVALCRILADGRYKVRVDCPTHKPYVYNLHRCADDFLNNGEDYWLSIDDDNPPVRNPLDLVELDLDLVGLPTPVYHADKLGERPFYYNALMAVDDEYAPTTMCNGLVEVDAIGSGCFLVARRVVKALQHSQMFSRQWDSRGFVTLGGDFNFCRKVKAAGFKIHAHFDYPCDHMLDGVPAREMIRHFYEWGQCNGDR